MWNVVKSVRLSDYYYYHNVCDGEPRDILVRLKDAPDVVRIMRCIPKEYQLTDPYTKTVYYWDQISYWHEIPSLTSLKE
jgi:hypothetical protein